MPDKNLVHVWKESLSSRPAPRITFKEMHLAVLHQATQQKPDNHLLHIQFEIHDFILCELKGLPEGLTGFELPEKGEEILWLCMQFHGTFSFPTGKVSQPDTLFSFISSGNETILTLPAEKQWVLLLGITGASRRQLLAEQPTLRKQYDQQKNNITVATPISYQERELLEAFSKKEFGPFAGLYHIGTLLAQLYASYTGQIGKQMMRQGKEDGLVALYHQAIRFITENYMDGQLNLEKVSAACHCSVRTLTRAFQGRSVSIMRSILLIRLHKGRELLRERPEWSIERIAGMLYFSDAKHFATQYKKCFHRTPREERKEWMDS